MPVISQSDWDAFISKYDNPHILQTSPWGELKASFGWKFVRVIAGKSGAQILIRRVLPGINLAYIPKGPIGDNWEHLWPEIDAICRANRCVFLKVEPDVWIDENQEGEDIQDMPPATFIQSPYSIQPMQTLLVDISGEENLILGRMKQKTRYNINLALKRNVKVTPRTDLSTFYDLMEITGERDQFGIHSLAYYQKAFDLFHGHDMCQLLVAEYDKVPISALLAFRSGERAWYFYGASSNQHRDRMPNYLLQWEAMRWAKSQGCSSYDLWGVPDVSIDILETNFTTRSDGLWGVYRFKRGFGGMIRRSAGPWDRIYIPVLYRLYSLWQYYRKTDE
jgi:peptidoglycan pentaglycine glycine transferase (the first glycine)